MDKKKIYISCPSEHKNMPRYKGRIWAAKKKITEHYGFEAIAPLDLNPHTTDFTEQEKASHINDILAKCDGIYLCYGWPYSKQCMRELQYAAARFYDVITYNGGIQHAKEPSDLDEPTRNKQEARKEEL